MSFLLKTPRSCRPNLQDAVPGRASAVSSGEEVSSKCLRNKCHKYWKPLGSLGGQDTSSWRTMRCPEPRQAPWPFCHREGVTTGAKQSSALVRWRGSWGRKGRAESRGRGWSQSNRLLYNEASHPAGPAAVERHGYPGSGGWHCCGPHPLPRTKEPCAASWGCSRPAPLLYPFTKALCTVKALTQPLLASQESSFVAL
ncbi:hypothetical protein NDU88_003960 [Pleurodeles waltl]|uniref:Uncharacterized protein n=1 Tax=Pleurodeles waltl TaxID=8319 RepID=A0AAV7TSL6_PLEWA|nr:hypothetical protein NDU88_003960 [Pleurodeles waltl]